MSDNAMSNLSPRAQCALPRCKSFLRLLIIVAVVLSAQFLGVVATMQSVTTWYPDLLKASWNPPPEVFGPVWGMLYAIMAWSAWRIWQQLVKRGEARPWRHHALRAFVLQLGLNVGWSWLFFGFRQPALALIEMALLWAAILWMLCAYRKVDRIAFYAQIPYFLWVSFAFTLNAAIVYLN